MAEADVEIEIDSELLITAIESRPILWDKTMETYKNRILTKDAWKDVCIELDPTFEDVSDAQKIKFGKEVMKRWSNIRDAYTRSNRKIEEAIRSGAGTSHLKKYIYNDQLQFLTKIIEPRSTDDSRTTEYSNSLLLTSNIEQSEECEHSFKKPRFTERLKINKNNKYDHVEEKLMQLLVKPEEENRHLSFFKGIIPSLSSFDDDEVIELQMGVLQLISNIKKQRASRTNRLSAIKNCTTKSQAVLKPGQSEFN